jgi:hypothetical protein
LLKSESWEWAQIWGVPNIAWDLIGCKAWWVQPSPNTHTEGKLISLSMCKWIHQKIGNYKNLICLHRYACAWTKGRKLQNISPHPLRTCVCTHHRYLLWSNALAIWGVFGNLTKRHATTPSPPPPHHGFFEVHQLAPFCHHDITTQ